MIQTTNTTKKAIIGIFIGIVMFAMSVPSAQAQTYYYASNQTYSNAQIQSLINQLTALIAELRALQGKTGPINDPKGQDSKGNYNVRVTTRDVDVESGDTAVLGASLNLDRASYAYVWFEYGKRGRLTEKTESFKLTTNRTFKIAVDDLDEDTQYSFRAVAEDPAGYRTYGSVKTFFTEDDDWNNNYGDTPEVQTDDAKDIKDRSAKLHGKVWMNDYENGTVFFVYGEDEDSVEEVEDESTYSRIDENGDDLKKVRVYSNLDDDRSFWVTVYGLDARTVHYFRICVEYEDDYNDDTLECGDVKRFTTR